ncbi:MAG: NfeD family protein [bacterium]
MNLIVTYLLGMALLFAELFAPGVVLGVLGGLVVIYAVAAAWLQGDYLTAVVLTASTVVVVPVMIRYALRRLSLRSSLPAEEGYAVAEGGLDALVGRDGIALTPLRPAGMADLDGRRVSVVAELGLIDADTPIHVVRVEGNRVVVRVAERAEPSAAVAPADRNRL